MRNLFRFLYAYHLVILFVLLVSAALFLVAGNNDFQRAAVRDAAQSVTAGVHTRVRAFREYFSLSGTNQKLAEQNSRLVDEIANLQTHAHADTAFRVSDTLHRQTYFCVPARTVNISVNKQRNYLTIDKGSEDGITPEMAVIDPQGAVGIVVGTSRHFATVMPLLHRDMNLSVRFRRNDAFGALSWPGANTRLASLHDIPLHIPVAAGDTIVTSRFSTMFPEGIPVGTVVSFDTSNGDFYSIVIELAADFHRIHHVTVIRDLTKEERDSLEQYAGRP